MSIKWKTKILLFKLEATYGVDPTPSGAANAILATGITLSPMEGNDVSRDLETPHLGAQGSIPTELHQKLSFKVELEPSGSAGVAPAWGPLLRACGVAETILATTSVTYNSVTDAHESATIHMYVGKTLYKMTGARGNCKMAVSAQGIVYLEFEFTGLWTKPAEGTRPTPDLTGFKKPNVATTANTPTFSLDGTGFVMRSFMMDLGNTVENRFLIGSESVEITDKSESVETTVEAVPLTNFDPFELASSQAIVPVVLVHGTAAGRIATLNCPTAQMQRPQGLQNAQNIKEWPLRLVPLPSLGNDQWTLTLT